MKKITVLLFGISCLITFGNTTKLDNTVYNSDGSKTTELANTFYSSDKKFNRNKIIPILKY